MYQRRAVHIFASARPVHVRQPVKVAANWQGVLQYDVGPYTSILAV
jgi:hypothetical protein